MDPNSADEVDFEFFPFVRVYKSGRVVRLIDPGTVPPGVDPATGVASKDVTINAKTGLSARLYLPAVNSLDEKLPILVYFHGGAFVIESAFSPTYHRFLCPVAAAARAVVVSVEYRRVPEHRLPVAYDDSWEALVWAVSGEADPWIASHGDARRVLLAGDSAGGNIAHNVAMRAAGADGAVPLPPSVKLQGLILFHPFFWSPDAGEHPAGKGKMEQDWRFLHPTSPGLDDPQLNPAAAVGPPLRAMPCGRALVCVAEKDFLRERGRAYHDALTKSGWSGEAELVVSEGEDHVFHILKPERPAAVALMERVFAFIAACSS